MGGRLPASSRVCFKSLDKFILFNCYSLLCRILGVNFLTVDGLVSSYTYIVFAAFAQSLQSNIQFLCICFLSTLEVCFLGVLYLIAVCCLFQMEACRIVASVHALQDIPDLPVSDPPKITKDKILIPFPDPFENNEARNPAALSFLFLILFLLIGYDRRKCPVCLLYTSDAADE